MQVFKSFYQGFINVGFWLGPVLLLGMRLIWGYAFYQAGCNKFDDIDKVVESFAGLGIPFAYYNAYLVAGVECIGGLWLMAGFMSRFAAALLAITMTVAYLTAHFDAVAALWTEPSLFMGEAPFMFWLTSLLVLSFGPGMFSIDALFKRFVFKQE